MCTLASLPLRSSTMGTYSTWRVCVWWFGDSGFFLFFLVLSTHIFHVWVCTYLYVLHSDGSVKGIATVDQGIAKDGSPKVSNTITSCKRLGCVCVCVCRLGLPVGWSYMPDLLSLARVAMALSPRHSSSSSISDTAANPRLMAWVSRR